MPSFSEHPPLYPNDDSSNDDTRSDEHSDEHLDTDLNSGTNLRRRLGQLLSLRRRRPHPLQSASSRARDHASSNDEDQTQLTDDGFCLPENPTQTEQAAFEITTRVTFMVSHTRNAFYHKLQSYGEDELTALLQMLDEPTLALLQDCSARFNSFYSVLILESILEQEGSFMALCECLYDAAHEPTTIPNSGKLHQDQLYLLFDYFIATTPTRAYRPTLASLLVLAKLRSQPSLSAWLREAFSTEKSTANSIAFMAEHPDQSDLFGDWHVIEALPRQLSLTIQHELLNHPNLDKVVELTSCSTFLDVLQRTAATYLGTIGGDYESAQRDILAVLLYKPELINLISSLQPEFAKTHSSNNIEYRSTIPWSRRLEIVYQFGEALGLAGATENELTAVIMYRHFCDATGTPDQTRIDAFVAKDPGERWREIAQVRSQFDLDTLKPYVAFVRQHPHQVADFAEQLDIPVGPGHDPSPIPGILTPEYLAQFDDYDYQPHLDHLRTKIGYEVEYHVPPHLQQVEKCVLLPILHQLGIKQGMGGSNFILEHSPGPFTSSETALAMYSLWNNLNLHVWAMRNPHNPDQTWLNFDSFHMSHQNFSHALSIVTSFAIALTGDVRGPTPQKTDLRRTPVYADSSSDGDYFEDKQPNGITSNGSRRALRRLFYLSAAQLAYEYTIMDIEPKFQSKELLSHDTEHPVADYSLLSQFRPPSAENANRSIKIIALPDEVITNSSLTEDQKQLALVFAQFMKSFREGLRQIPAMVLTKNDNRDVLEMWTMEELLCNHLPQELRQKMNDILQLVFPTLADYHDPERIFGVLDRERTITSDGVIYPNLIAFVETLVADTQQKIERIFEQVDADFLRMLMEVQRLLALDTEEVSRELAQAVTALFSRFPCGLDNKDLPTISLLIHNAQALIELYLPTT